MTRNGCPELDDRFEWGVDTPDEISKGRVARRKSIDTTEVDGDCPYGGVEGEHTEKRKGNRSRDRALRVSNLFAERGDSGVSGEGEKEKAGGLQSAKHTLVRA